MLSARPAVPGSCRRRRHAPLRASASDGPPLSARAATLSAQDALSLPMRVALGLLADPLSWGQEVAASASRLLSASSASSSVTDTLAAAWSEADASAARCVERCEALRGSAPPQLLSLLPPPLPPPPSFYAQTARETDEPYRGVSSTATFSPGPPQRLALFEGGVAANRAGSELERFTSEVRSLREAAAEAGPAGSSSLARLRQEGALRRLCAHLAEIEGEEGVGEEGLPEAEAVREVLSQLRALCAEAAPSATSNA